MQPITKRHPATRTSTALPILHIPSLHAQALSLACDYCSYSSSMNPTTEISRNCSASPKLFDDLHPTPSTSQRHPSLRHHAHARCGTSKRFQRSTRSRSGEQIDSPLSLNIESLISSRGMDSGSLAQMKPLFPSPNPSATARASSPAQLVIIQRRTSDN